jgi:hypothetical protein
MGLTRGFVVDTVPYEVCIRKRLAHPDFVQEVRGQPFDVVDRIVRAELSDLLVIVISIQAMGSDRYRTMTWRAAAGGTDHTLKFTDASSDRYEVDGVDMEVLHAALLSMDASGGWGALPAIRIRGLGPQKTVGSLDRLQFLDIIETSDSRSRLTSDGIFLRKHIDEGHWEAMRRYSRRVKNFEEWLVRLGAPPDEDDQSD